MLPKGIVGEETDLLKVKGGSGERQWPTFSDGQAVCSVVELVETVLC